MRHLKIALAPVIASSLVAGSVFAETFNASATVSNTISLTETTPFTFGSLFIKRGADADNQDAGSGAIDPATLVVTPAGATTGSVEDGDETDVPSKIVSLGGITVGVVSVTGAAPFGSLTVTSNATPTNLTHSSGNPALPPIVFSSIATSPANGSSLTLDANGDGNINVGGTIVASYVNGSATVSTDYADGTYTGSYTITVSY